MIKEDLIKWVLLQFAYMGATPQEILEEHRKLSTDLHYLLDFVSSCSHIGNNTLNEGFEVQYAAL